MEKKKEETKSVSPFLETRDLNFLGKKTGNLYKSINVVSIRASQLNATLKEELLKKLE